jgi:hypothetical protein
MAGQEVSSKQFAIAGIVSTVEQRDASRITFFDRERRARQGSAGDRCGGDSGAFLLCEG